MKALGEILKERNIVFEASNPVTAEGFTQVPNFILRSPTLSVGASRPWGMPSSGGFSLWHGKVWGLRPATGAG
mgnify:CR=1 FL=1